MNGLLSVQIVVKLVEELYLPISRCVIPAAVFLFPRDLICISLQNFNVKTRGSSRAEEHLLSLDNKRMWVVKRQDTRPSWFIS